MAVLYTVFIVEQNTLILKMYYQYILEFIRKIILRESNTITASFLLKNPKMFLIIFLKMKYIRMIVIDASEKKGMNTMYSTHSHPHVAAMHSKHTHQCGLRSHIQPISKGLS